MQLNTVILLYCYIVQITPLLWNRNVLMFRMWFLYFLSPGHKWYANPQFSLNVILSPENFIQVFNSHSLCLSLSRSLADRVVCWPFDGRMHSETFWSLSLLLENIQFCANINLWLKDFIFERQMLIIFSAKSKILTVSQ